mgnify:CR=1 FL=1
MNARYHRNRGRTSGHGIMEVSDTNNQGSYSMARAKVRILRRGCCCRLSATKDISATKDVLFRCTKINQWRRLGSISWKQQIGAKREATVNTRNTLLETPQTLPNPTPENYREVQVVLGGGCQCVRLRRFDVCIKMAWCCLQGTRMLIAAEIVATYCHHYPHTSHNLYWRWIQFSSLGFWTWIFYLWAGRASVLRHAGKQTESRASDDRGSQSRAFFLLARSFWRKIRTVQITRSLKCPISTVHGPRFPLARKEGRKEGRPLYDLVAYSCRRAAMANRKYVSLSSPVCVSSDGCIDWLIAPDEWTLFKHLA